MSQFTSLVLALLVGTASAQEARLKIATVDVQRLFKDYHRTVEAQKEINVETARIQKHGNDRLARIRELDTALQNLRKQLEDPTGAESKKQSIRMEFNAKQQEGIQLQREREDFLQQRTQLLNEKKIHRMRGILEEIRKLVEEKAKTEDFDYVFDKSGLSSVQVPFLLYTREASDLTSDLLKSLNRDAPAPANENGAGDKAAAELNRAD